MRRKPKWNKDERSLELYIQTICSEKCEDKSLVKFIKAIWPYIAARNMAIKHAQPYEQEWMDFTCACLIDYYKSVDSEFRQQIEKALVMDPELRQQIEKALVKN
jgi:hypothetical protein